MEPLRMNPALAGEDGIEVTRPRISSFPLHSHSYYELLLYPAFSGGVTVNGRHVPLDAPVAVLMTPLDLHEISYGGDPQRACIKIAFTEDAIGSHLARRLKSALFSRDETASALLEALAEHDSHEDRTVLLRAAVLLLLGRGTPIGDGGRSVAGSLAAAATAIIGEEFREDLTLGELAARLNVSYQHLSAVFAERTGMPFSAYLADVRLRYARSLLTASDLSVTEICYASGYRSLSHFLRSFKRRFGETPKAYRARAGASPEVSR